MIRNNKLIETMQECVKRNGLCKGCFYGNGEEQPFCMLHMMNDMLFFFGVPHPSKDAYVLKLEELEEILGDRKDHIAFAEFISSIHVAKPVIRSVSMSRNTITLFDPNTNEENTFTKDEYYVNFRVWSTKPTDELRNATPWESPDKLEDTEQTESLSKTSSIMRQAYSIMHQNRT